MRKSLHKPHRFGYTPKINHIYLPKRMLIFYTRRKPVRFFGAFSVSEKKQFFLLFFPCLQNLRVTSLWQKLNWYPVKLIRTLFYATVKFNNKGKAPTLKLNIAELYLTTAIKKLQGKTQG